jgi:hypothetical protein
MGSNKVNPPPGFVIDTLPPEGFVMDSPGSPSSSPDPSLWDKALSFLKDVGRGTVEQLPAIGATGGAMAAAVPGVATGPFAPAVVVGGAGAGGLAGESLKQLLGPLVGLKGPQSPQDASLARAGAGGEAMMGQMGGEGAVKILGKMIAPFLNRMTPESTQLLKSSREANVPMDPNAINPSMPGKALMKTSEGVLTGKPMLNYQRRKAVEKINELTTQFTAPAKEAEVVGTGVKEALGGEGGAVENFWAKSKGLYDDFYKAANQGAAPSVNTNPMREKMHELLGPELKLPKAQQDTKLVDFFEDVLKNQPENMNPKQLHEIQKRLYDIGANDRGKVKAIKDAIDKSWDAYGEQVQSDVLGALSKARTSFKEGMSELIENPLVKKLIKDESLPNSIQPGRVISAIYTPGNEKVVANLKKYLPADTVEDMNARYLANFFDERSAIGQRVIKSVGLEKYVDGEALLKAVTSHKSVLESVFDAKTVKALENLALLSKASMGDMKALQNQNMGILGNLMNIGAGGGAITSSLTGGGSLPMVGVIGGSIAAPGIARSLMAPNGILKTWLTEGLKLGPMTKEGLKLGGREIAMGKKE